MPKVIPVSEKLFKYVHDSFRGAGVDSYTDPPGQNPEMFERLENIQPVEKGTLRRRWGYELFSNPALTARRTYSFQKDSDSTRRIIITSSSGIEATDENGTSHNGNIFTLSSGAGHPRVVVSRDYAYFLDGVAADLKKWDGSATGGTSRWGIVGQITATADTATGTGANDTTSGTVAWSNPGNILTSDDTRATATITSINTTTQWLRATNFGFTVPAGATIKGITIKFEGHRDTDAGAGGSTVIRLVKGGTILASTEETFGLGTVNWPEDTDSTVTYGSTEDLWNEVWTPADVNSSGFGVALQAIFAGSVGANLTFRVDRVQVSIAYEQAITVGATVAGSVTLVSGRKYTVCYRNSVTGHNSDILPFSASTGPITTDNIPLSNIPASTDTQVDRKLVLATADGGDETVLYMLADLPNATTTLTDDVPETTLLLRPIYLETDEFGFERGVTDNTPPPNGTLPLKHRGRLYMVSGQNLYFTKNLSDLVTSTGHIAGRYEECWPADYYIDISEGAETPKGLLSDGEVLYIGTERHIRRLYGDGPTNFQKPEVVFNNVGILNQEVWQPVFLEGSPVGVMWLTPDFRVVGSDFNTYQNVGREIQDTLDSIATGSASKCCAMAASFKGFDLYLLAIPTGANTEPDTVCVYNLKTKKWVIWKPTDKATAFLYNVNASGIPQLLFGTDTGKLYKFLDTATQDRVGDTPVSFPATIQTGFLDFGDPTLRKQLNEMEVMTGDSAMTVTVVGASTNAEFASPTTVVTAGALVNKPLGERMLRLAGKVAKDRFYRFKFESTGTETRVLDSYSVEVAPVHRI